MSDRYHPQIDRVTLVGMLVVAAASVALSFMALMDLAALCGFVPALAWLLPISIDAYAVTATRVWLRGGVSDRTRRYARRNAVGAIALSVAGNATFHSLSAAGVSSLVGRGSGQLLVIAVSAAPPVMLGLVGHLHALLSSETRTASTAAAVPAAGDSAGISAPAPGVTGPPAPAAVAPVAPVAPATSPILPPAACAPAVVEHLAAGRDVPRPARREGTKSDRLRALVAAEVEPGDGRSVAELAREFAPRVDANESHARKVIAPLLREMAGITGPESRVDLAQGGRTDATDEHENTDRDSNVVQLAVMAGRGGQQA